MASPAKTWVVAAWSLGATALGLLPGLGLPGGIMLAIGGIALSPLERIFPRLNQETWSADAWWPAAILLTFTLFPFLVIAHHVAFRLLRKKPRAVKWAAWFGVLLSWSIVGYAVMAYMATNGL